MGAASAPRGAEADLEVFFALRRGTADDAIIDACRKMEGTAPLTVVTSDEKDIASKVRGLRLRHWTSEEFAEIIDETMRRPRAARSPAHGSAPAAPASEKPS